MGCKEAEGKGFREGWDSKELWKSVEKAKVSGAKSACSAQGNLAGLIEGRKRGEALKSTMQFTLMFTVGLSVGALAHSLIGRNTSNQTKQSIENPYNEEQINGIINNFQRNLDKLKVAKDAEDAEQLSKRVEAQLGILDINTKFRESQYAKVAPFMGLAGVLLGWVLGALAPRLLNKRGAGANPNP